MASKTRSRRRPSLVLCNSVWTVALASGQLFALRHVPILTAAAEVRLFHFNRFVKVVIGILCPLLADSVQQEPCGRLCDFDVAFSFIKQFYLRRVKWGKIAIAHVRSETFERYMGFLFLVSVVSQRILVNRAFKPLGRGFLGQENVHPHSKS